MHLEKINGRNRLVLDDEGKDVARAMIALDRMPGTGLLNAAVLRIGHPLPHAIGHAITVGVWNMALESAQKHGTPEPPRFHGNLTPEDFEAALVGCDALIEDIPLHVD